MKKKQSTSLIVKAIMLLLALIVMVFVSSLAWFTSADAPASATGLSVNSGKQEDFEIAIGFSNKMTDNEYVMSDFLRSFKLTSVEAKPPTADDTAYALYNVFNDFSAQDLTGDGITLVRPKLVNKNKDIDKVTLGREIGTPNLDYISFDLYIKAPNPCNVFLADETRAYGLAESQDGKLAPYSGSTDFSEDGIVGALRVSFCDYATDDDTYTYSTSEEDVNRTAPNALWIPRSDIRYDDSVGEPVLYTGITDRMSQYASYTTTDIDGSVVNMNTFDHHYFYYYLDSQTNSFDYNLSGYRTFDDAITTTITGLSKENIDICEVSHPITDTNGDTYYYGKMHVNIWIEGCDSEARRDFNAGKFYLDFDLITKDIAVAD